jgi:hypothetical protein
MGEGLASFGLQTVTTVCYAYSTDVLISRRVSANM